MRWVLGCAAILLVGCAGNAVDVGSNYGAGGPSGTGGSDGGVGTMIQDAGLLGWPSPAACKDGDQLPIVGTWEGYMEKANFPSRSDAVKLVISSANANHVCGSITMGAGTPPPVPADPDNPSLPGITDGGPVFGDVGGDHLIDGFPLTLLNAKPSLPRLQFVANAAEFWKPWCELQTPYLREGTSDEWHCVPLNAQGETTYTPATGCLLGPLQGGVPVDCTKAGLCGGNGACSCLGMGCSVWGGGGGLQFDLRVTGEEIDGPGPRGDLHLTRVR